MRSYSAMSHHRPRSRRLLLDDSIVAPTQPPTTAAHEKRLAGDQIRNTVTDRIRRFPIPFSSLFLTYFTRVNFMTNASDPAALENVSGERVLVKRFHCVRPFTDCTVHSNRSRCDPMRVGIQEADDRPVQDAICSKAIHDDLRLLGVPSNSEDPIVERLGFRVHRELDQYYILVQSPFILDQNF